MHRVVVVDRLARARCQPRHWHKHECKDFLYCMCNLGVTNYFPQECEIEKMFKWRIFPPSFRVGLLTPLLLRPCVVVVVVVDKKTSNLGDKIMIYQHKKNI